MTMTKSSTARKPPEPLRFNELQQRLKDELKRICGDKVSWGAYGCTECGGEVTRGPHITVCFITNEAPQVFNVHELLAVFNMYYTDVTWDGGIWHGKIGGTVHHPGESTQITFDIVSKGTDSEDTEDKEEIQKCLLSGTT